MDFMELVNTRYSSRAYKDTPVEREKLESVAEAGRMSPTAKNLQPVKVLAVTSEEGLAKIGETANLYGAPAAFIVCGDSEACFERKFDGKRFHEIDATIVTTQMRYQAADLGLGSVWIGWFDHAVISERFGLPDNLFPVNILAVGYRDDETSRNKGNRKPLSEFVEFC